MKRYRFREDLSTSHSIWQCRAHTAFPEEVPWRAGHLSRERLKSMIKSSSTATINPLNHLLSALKHSTKPSITEKLETMWAFWLEESLGNRLIEDW
jgi:hypothetical protein